MSTRETHSVYRLRVFRIIRPMSAGEYFIPGLLKFPYGNIWRCESKNNDKVPDREHFRTS